MSKWFTLILLLILPLTSTAQQSAEEKGLAISQKADRLDSGWADQMADMQMLLRNKQGDESTRIIRISTLEVTDDGDKSLSIFDNPRDVKGTAFLSHTHSLQADDQWLFLPALKRVKRISSSNKSGPFMGSEFAYEDMSSQEVDKYTYKWLRDEAFDGRQSFVVERYPVDKNSGYTRQVVWVDKAMYQPLKIVFYDRKNARLKSLTYHDYQHHLGKYWRAGRMEMINHQSGKSTLLNWENFRFNNGLTDRDFNKNALVKSR